VSSGAYELTLAVAFALRPHVAERMAGLAVVVAIFTSVCVAAVATSQRGSRTDRTVWGGQLRRTREALRKRQ
jgi:hypothetical protein